MTDTPILFTPENVRAILDGRKTQTRRIVKPQPPCECEYVINGAQSHALCRSIYNFNQWVPPTPKSKDHRLPCPYGQPGDRLWVRETWTARTDVEPRTDKAKQYVRYKADNSDLSMEWHRYHHWSPSIHMLKMYCRLSLELTEVRVERLQEVSRGDAKAEGFLPGLNGLEQFGGKSYGNAQLAYRAYWESINGAGSWAANPFVWALSFQPTKGARDE